MSEEKVLTLRGKRAVWAPGGGSGPIDPKRLPEGYPYKEGVSIEWDGNTEGLTSVDNMWFKVSDATMTNEEIKNATMVMVGESGATSIKIADFGAHFGLPVDVWDHLVSAGSITDDACFFVVDSLWFAVVRKGNMTVDGHTFVETGTYFMYASDTMYVSGLANETIHPMAPEFLPALTSPNGTKYQLTVADDGTLSAVAIE